MYLSITGFLFLTISIIVQSVPVKPIEKLTPSSEKAPSESIDPLKSSTSTITPAKVHEINNIKKKRYAEEYNQFDEFMDDDSDDDDDEDDIKIEHKLHAKIKETPAKIHDNADKPVDTDDSKIFSDIQMNPNEFTNFARKRRNINLNSESIQRRKRALSPYDLYNIDPLYDSYIERQQFIRPSRKFESLYWNQPSFYERSIRSALFEQPEWNRIYTEDPYENDYNDENQDLSFYDDDNDSDEEYEPYLNLLESASIPFDNLQLQQKYNTDNLLNNDDDDDEDEGLFPVRYDPFK
ncbi:unnamed protein product [Adineta steineri]|uniref:Uncharacterized protein n=1 Tax=Adineta steineri TaxID=433720 RepID=A0A819LW67_9BILA|nr:unnamed protein product [Adineta steineri]CAF3967875.1 unnamed protein product [Adineta steineri]